ncbi:MAG: PhoPQ-activated pathogenicity-like protein PqaA type [Thermotogae bacterium]|nr:PhoPQ-activated pathogenicity-like protein PqaA type [Thermotogota bacterium]
MKKYVVAFIVSALLNVLVLGHVLSEYVAQHKSEVAWSFLEERTLEDGTQIHFLQVKSQVWKGIEWRNRVAVIYPLNARRRDVAVMLVVGSFSRDVSESLWIAKAFGIPFCVVGDVPNQPLFGGYQEDDLIAYTFTRYLETEEKDWPLLFPMVQSVVAAMDAVQSYTSSRGREIGSFVVTGASKRGWTTWLTAAIDERVKAIIPMVYDNLNLPWQMPHQLEMWGEYSEKIAPYTRRGLPDLLSSPQGKKLVEMVDPFSLKEDLKVPKLLIIATNDRYWPVDAANLYIGEIPGENFILYVPNDGHDITNVAHVALNAASFTKAVIANALPKLRWHFLTTKDLIQVSWDVDVEIEEANLWSARSTTTDFRNSIWTKKELDPTRKSTKVKADQRFNLAFFVELVIKTEKGKLHLCSPVRVLKSSS